LPESAVWYCVAQQTARLFEEVVADLAGLAAPAAVAVLVVLVD
jgi:hypothetical protein